MDEDTPANLPPTPDFDSYPVTASILAAEPADRGRVLRVTWSDGRHSRYHAIWLRDNASDEDNLNLETREQRSDVTAIPEDIRIVAARVDPAGALELRWSRGPAVSCFHPGWLRAHDYSNPRICDEAAIEPKGWDADSLPEPPSFDGAAILENDEVLEAWLEALCRHGIARLRDVPAQPGMVARVAARIGPLRETNFGRVFNVRVQSDPRL